MDGTWGRLDAVCQKFLILFASVLFVCLFSHSARANPSPECVIVDSDVDLDDIRAVAALASSKNVVAIVTTEGVSRAKEGAAAMQYFLQRIGKTIPVIPGAQPNQHRDYISPPDLPIWRQTAETLNGTFSAGERLADSTPGPERQSNAEDATIVDKLWPLLQDCHRVELLVIGPWTSFMRYGPELLDRIDLIVAQGRPDPDEPEGQPTGFNCLYDLNSCLSAYDLLVGRRQRTNRHLRANWVDIPQSPVPLGLAEAGVDADGKRIYPFSPTLAWTADLQKAGNGAAVVSEILLKDPNGWKNTSLWDDLAALYLLRPELFDRRGGHWEPQVKAAVVREVLTDYMARK